MIEQNASHDRLRARIERRLEIRDDWTRRALCAVAKPDIPRAYHVFGARRRGRVRPGGDADSPDGCRQGFHMAVFTAIQ
ncbi:MAG: hypothetical protein P8Y27_12365 [Chromatiaceae bacterium]